MLSFLLSRLTVLSLVLTLLMPTLQTPVAGGQSIGDPFAPELGNTGYDVTHYDLGLKFDLDRGTLDGVATIDAKATLDSLGSLSLDFSKLQANAVTVDGTSVQFKEDIEAQKLFITLPKSLANGTNFKIVVNYGGMPQTYDSRYIGFLPIGLYVDTKLHRAFAVDEPDGAHTWFPCNDHPRDRATFTFHITAGVGLTVVANGQQQGDPVKNADGTQTFTWDMPHPIPTYLATVDIADYAVEPLPGPSPVPVAIYAYRGQIDQAVKSFSNTGSLLQFEQAKFGPYDFDSYGQVVVEQQAVALETASMTTMPDGIIGSSPEQNLIVIAHEMAHQWFGDSVALYSWADIWLNEGFASYAEYLAIEDRYGATAAQQLLDGWEEGLSFSPPDPPVDAPTPQSMFGNATYVKGGFVLHMLRREIGDAAFFKTLQTYTARFRESNATTGDFRKVAEEVSGKSLSTFFDQWLQREGIPILTFVWTQKNGQVDALVCQMSAQPYTLTLPVVLKDDSKPAADKQDRETIAIRDMKGVIHLTPGFDVGLWVIDPDQDILASTSFRQVDTLPSTCD